MVTERFFKNKVLERLRTRETFKRGQTASTVPQFNYMIKVQGLKGVKLIGDNTFFNVRKTISYRVLNSYLGTRFFYYTCAHLSPPLRKKTVQTPFKDV